MTAQAKTIRAPRGASLSCKGWPQEAAYRMIQNNLDPEVAERPEDLVVYGGTGKAARTWPDFERILKSLRELESDETLLVQSGRPVGIAKTHPDAPRVLIANSLLVPHWATWEEFRRLEGLGLTMFGQMTAGSWIYIGTQGILQGTYETFGACARERFGGSLKGKLVATGGLGGMGGAQPLSVTMNEGVCLAAEVDPRRVERRLETGYLDRASSNLERSSRLVLRGDESGPAPLRRPPRERGRYASRSPRPRRRPRRAHGSDVGPRRAERLRAERNELRGRARLACGRIPGGT